jgi:hypothetical protein
MTKKRLSIFSVSGVALLSLFFLVACGSDRATTIERLAANAKQVVGPEDADNFARVFYVSPDGDDAGEGSRDNPFASLEAARDAIRGLPAEQRTGDILVWVAPGDYYRKSSFLLSLEDSGAAESRIVYRGGGAPGSAQLIGGTKLTGWEPYADGIFRVDVSGLKPFHTLYENGIRARKARFPSYEFDARFPLSGWRYLNAESGTDTELVWREGDLDSIDVSQLGNRANLVFWPWGYADWHKVTRRISAISPDQRKIVVPENLGNVAIGRQARFYIEGALSLLDQPGEFYLDEDQGMLYYWPRFGNPDQQKIIAPQLNRLILLEGIAFDQPLQHLVIEGFKLGYSDTFAHMTGPILFPWSTMTDFGAHGIIHLKYTENVTIQFNHVHSSGLNGIYLEQSNKHNRIYGNWIEDMGISGICIAYHRQARELPNDMNEHNFVANNLIHHLGSIGVDSFGINIWGASNNELAYNEIFDAARYAVTVRGPFTQHQFQHTNRPDTENNLIRHSHFYRLGQDSGDMGALHMAGISTPEIRPVNTMKQILIEDVLAHPSMQDVRPNGIFLDYPGGVTDQVFRDIEIRNTEVPYRANNTDIRHTFDNVSFRGEFDVNRMEYARIGLREDFPVNFRNPGEISDVSVREVTRRGERLLNLSWGDPADTDLKDIIITAEGVVGYEAVVVNAGRQQAVVPRPLVDGLAMLRIRSRDTHGNLSQGILIPAAQIPAPVSALRSEGVDGGAKLFWQGSPVASAYEIRVAMPGHTPLRIAADAESAVITGLANGRTYQVEVLVVDADGIAWPGATLRVPAGEGVPVPTDAAAWWTFDEDAIRHGQSLGDASGNGHTLFIADPAVELVEGRFGRALRFDGEDAFARVLAPEPLAIGAGDFAVSMWIRQSSTGNHTERVFEFGGTGEPGLTIMANNTDVRVLFTAGETRFGPFFRGLDMVDQWRHVVINIKRDSNLSIFVDGEELTSEDISSVAGVAIPAAPYMHLGRFKNSRNPRHNWPGDLDQLRIFQRALTLDEIIALFLEE